MPRCYCEHEEEQHFADTICMGTRGCMCPVYIPDLNTGEDT